MEHRTPRKLTTFTGTCNEDYMGWGFFALKCFCMGVRANISGRGEKYFMPERNNIARKGYIECRKI